MRFESDLHDYQLDGIDHLVENPESGLFADVGLGKAIMALTAIARVPMLEPRLVLAPVRVAKQTWPTEIKEWEHVKHLTHTLIRAEDDMEPIKSIHSDHSKFAYDNAKTAGLTGRWCSRVAGQYAQPVRARAKQIVWERLVHEPTDIHIANVEQTERLVAYWGKNWPYRHVVIDESSKFKNHATARFKALNSVRKYIERINILTASPAPETYMDLFAQIYLLDRGERFGRYITHFRDEHFFHNDRTHVYKLRKGHDEIISEKVADICMVMKAEDHLSLEKPTFLDRFLEFDEKTQALYDQFAEEFILSLTDDVEIEAINGAALTNKLLQFTAGAVYDEEKRIHEIHDEKIEDLKELIEELQGEPLMVAYWFKSSLARLRKSFPHATVMDKSGNCVADWNKGKIPLLFIHPASAGHGLNMQLGPGHDLDFYDIPWSRELYEQIVGRLARQGQRKPVRVWRQIVRNTFDEIVIKAQDDKGAGQEALFQFIKEIRRKFRDRGR